MRCHTAEKPGFHPRSMKKHPDIKLVSSTLYTVVLTEEAMAFPRTIPTTIPHFWIKHDVENHPRDLTALGNAGENMSWNELRLSLRNFSSPAVGAQVSDLQQLLVYSDHRSHRHLSYVDCFASVTIASLERGSSWTISPLDSRRRSS